MAPGARLPTVTEPPGLISLSRLFGVTLKLSCAPLIAELTPHFTNVSFEFLDRVGSVQWPCNEKAPMGTPIMHIDNFVRGKGLFVETDFVTTEYSDWATNCPEYKVTAVQVAPASHRSEWQHGFDENAKRQAKFLETAE